MSGKGRRHNQRGRSRTGGSFVKLEHWMMERPAWRALSAVERVIYIEVAALYRGPDTNNGALAMSARRAASLARCNKDTAQKALKRLCEIGFLHVVTPGGFSRKTPHAAEYALDMYADDVGEHKGQLALKRFASWTSEGQQKTHGP